MRARSCRPVGTFRLGPRPQRRPPGPRRIRRAAGRDAWSGGRRTRRRERARRERAHAPCSPRGPGLSCGKGAPGAHQPVRRVARVRGSRPGAPSHPPAGRVGGAAEGREDRQAQGWSRRQVRPRRAGPGAGGGARGFIVYGAGPARIFRPFLHSSVAPEPAPLPGPRTHGQQRWPRQWDRQAVV